MKLAILLATYNSQAYLREQLDSIFNQSYSDYTLYIRDDGSCDDTLSIIRDYSKCHSNLILLDDSVCNRKSMGSFMWLLEHVEADYYMFCDHDDVWLPDKIKISLDKMIEIEVKNKSALVCSDLKVVDENLNLISSSFWNYMKLRPKLLVEKKYAVSCNLFTGCTMLINNKAKETALPLGKYATMHDGWIGLNVIANNGVIGCIEDPLILYRQHQDNVCGAKEVSMHWRYFKYKFQTLSSVLRSYRQNYMMATEIFGHIRIVSFIFYRLLYLIRR